MAFSLLRRWFGGTRRGTDEARLLHRCHGDAALVERLIAHELARRPEVSRAAAARSAMERWNRDR
ncbi:MAG: hypothetical protein JNL83_15425 [Myxococcales bacterium]|nr:hypothetical protein [Myxococcales bacterium]